RTLKPPRTQKDLFLEIFGCLYHKATVWLVRKKLDSAHEVIQEQFIGYGRTQRGLWGKFVAALRASDIVSSSDEGSDVRSPSREENGLPMALRDTARIISPPKDVCPYCEEQLPDLPVPMPTLTCAYGRLPKPGQLVLLGRHCSQHVFETQHLSRARAENWPTNIDFTSLHEHYSFSTREGAVPQGWHAEGTDIPLLFPCVLTVLDSYGETGALLIFQALQNMFPADPTALGRDGPMLQLERIRPLLHKEFLELVLVPEVSTLLIASDLDLDPDGAMETWESSAEYGHDDIQQAISQGKGKGKAKVHGKGEWKKGRVKEESEEIPCRVLIQDDQEILIVD
ncbi:hypothetical protein JB92DRAFT_2841005, partial [Gautieria morchelliformis]